ncbi:hypothetical protein Xbed_03521 [Xenorhabdus beddingii]|uniref:Uncharacterized protein n=1 Tax=Xenorhabdus beddingii TaxID=40578 RepID=A0A1Y2SCQ2_9GAMM|nr:hypothetical protein Xbed_03521 [Xenorhabdus beddingii]
MFMCDQPHYITPANILIGNCLICETDMGFGIRPRNAACTKIYDQDNIFQRYDLQMKILLLTCFIATLRQHLGEN